MKAHDPSDRVYDRSFESLDAIFANADAFFASHDVDAQTSFALKLAIEEIFTNFVKYNPKGEDGIAVNMDREGNAIKVYLIDPDSDEFDLTEFDQADTTSRLDDRVAGGLGIFLVKKMVDNLEYHHFERTSRIVLTKTMSR